MSVLGSLVNCTVNVEGSRGLSELEGPVALEMLAWMMGVDYTHTL